MTIADSFDVGFMLVNLLKIGVAYLLALPLGWERDKSTHMGLRTFSLVAVASCGYVLISMAVIGPEPAADAHARTIQGLMSGIGFIGGGAILKDGATIKGMATAASIWTTGAIGAASGYGHYEIAILLSVINFLTLRWLVRL